MLPEEGNTPSAGTKSQALHRVLMGGNLMIHNIVRGVNGMGGGIGTTAAPTSGQQQGAGKDITVWSSLTEAVKMFGKADITQEFSKNF